MGLSEHQQQHQAGRGMFWSISLQSLKLRGGEVWASNCSSCKTQSSQAQEPFLKELHQHSTAQQFMTDVKRGLKTFKPPSQYFSQEEKELQQDFNKNTSTQV